MDELWLPDGLAASLCGLLDGAADRVAAVRDAAPGPPAAGDAAGVAGALARLDALLRDDLGALSAECTAVGDGVRRAAAGLGEADLGVGAALRLPRGALPAPEGLLR